MSNALDNLFGNLNACYFLSKQKLLFDLFYPELEKAANNYFQPTQSHADQDAFFNRFTPIWVDLIQKCRYFEAMNVWNVALKLAFQWEQKNHPNTIHKGTPYYFLGVTAILNNELEKGFLLMHQALEEDKRTLKTQIPPTPAYYFVTLDYVNQKQFFRLKVEEISNYLSERIDRYANSRSGTLAIDQFKTKFLECTALSEEVFLFVFLLFKLKLILETNDRLKQNVFSSLIHARLLFDICLVLEKAIEHKNHKSKHGSKLSFSNEMKFLSQKASLSIDCFVIKKLNFDFRADFAKTINDMLGSKYSLELSDIKIDLAIAYGIRNFVAHRVEDQPVLYKNFDELSQRLLNALFFAVEKLY
ncbi:MAG: hypothetical protein N3D85_07885 [Candidatus Bathyarchaeota archaeon]|nr:hypothetical protein [Candidatus Bathyarchaeota archaeon]